VAHPVKAKSRVVKPKQEIFDTDFIAAEFFVAELMGTKFIDRSQIIGLNMTKWGQGFLLI